MVEHRSPKPGVGGSSPSWPATDASGGARQDIRGQVMAVAEARKMEKSEQVSAGPPNWVSGPLGWGPRKFGELKTFFVGFYLYGLDILLSQLFTKVLGSR